MADSLTEFERDAIGELLNIAIGQAAAALSELAATEVLLSIPEVRYLPWSEALLCLGGGAERQLVGVSERFHGPIKGVATLVFPEYKSLSLVRALLREQSDATALTNLQEEVLIEVGNILLNSCLASIANMMRWELQVDLPTFARGDAREVVPLNDADDTQEQAMLLVQVGFNLANSNVSGYLTLTLALPAVLCLVQGMQQVLQAA